MWALRDRPMATQTPPPERPRPHLLGGLLSEQSAARAFVSRWLASPTSLWVRRGIIAAFAVGFSVPYFRLFNQVQVEGDELLEQLPRTNVVFLANHQTYFLEAIAFFDVVYVRRALPLEDPMLRFSAASETLRMNPVTWIMALAGGVSVKRRYRDRGRAVNRPPDLDGIARITQAIRRGWLLHFPTGTTKHRAPVRPGVARLLHDTQPVVVPVRVDGFRPMLLLRQLPGRFFRRCRVRIRPPLDLAAFYEGPLTDEAVQEVIRRIAEAHKPAGEVAATGADQAPA
jgi:1-acyl-sn-glycerol-3-phosphate acyltransferase